tara:strand:- start:410 stop:1108 length:699 start_codon:yes stop_codon:yes gene_type:complete
MINKRIIVAIDSNNLNKSIDLVKTLKNEVYGFKIGYEFFFNFGIIGYKKIKEICPNIFLDMKLHDIPNTVNNGIIAINKLKPLLTTIHISGGDEMMKQTRVSNKFTKILGVSILTSMDSKQTKKYYNSKNVTMLVKKLAKEAKKNKLDGIVCSPKEIKIIRKELGKKFLIITPGIRLLKNIKMKDDQKRILTPAKAIELGADLLVIGRPITQSKNPLKIVKEINTSLIKNDY